MRKVREIMDQSDALVARRCRTQTALHKRRHLRHWVPRFTWIGETLHNVCSTNLEKA